LAITAIPGVVAAGESWKKVWQEGGNSADGIIAAKDGGVLVAQEDYDAVLRIDPNGKASVAVANAKGVGSLAMDRQGRLYGVHRTERPESTKPDKASIVNAVTVLSPERRTIAETWTDGTPLTVRPNDLVADSRGGAYFTGGCVYYAGPKGVAVAADDLRTNGIILSPDDKTVYVTNGGEVVAFDLTLEAGQLEVSVGVDEAGRDGRVREGPLPDVRRRGDVGIRSNGRDPAIRADQHRTGGDPRPVDRQHPPGGKPDSGHVSAEAWPAWVRAHRHP
jgi:sugar lactone lactonase YvrE